MLFFGQIQIRVITYFQNIQSILFYEILNTVFSVASENRGEFLEKLQRARTAVKITTNSQPILSRPGPTRLVVGNWSLTSRKESELHIHNCDGQHQTTILREDLPGFIFESNRGTKHSFTAETILGELVF